MMEMTKILREGKRITRVDEVMEVKSERPPAFRCRVYPYQNIFLDKTSCLGTTCGI